MTLTYFFIDLVKGVIQWPFWWYSKGLILAIRTAREAISGYAKVLGIPVWIKNFFVPMYGTRDWQSRLISVFMRAVQIVGRSIALAAWVFAVFLLLVMYVVVPIFSFSMFLFHLTAFVI